MIERGEIVQAEKVLRRFVEAADKGFECIDDSYGVLWPLCQQAVALWGKAWAKIESRDTVTLGEMVFGKLQDNGYGLCDDIIGDFADALGDDGLLVLKNLFQTQYETRAADKGCDQWKRQEPLRRMADLADAMNDVDLYIDVQRQCDLTDVYAMSIARRLLDADRAAEALEYLDRGDPSRSHFRGEEDDYATLRSKILQSLGRDDEARDTLWRKFEHSLDRGALDRFLAMTSEDKREDELQQAVAVAQEYREKLTAAKFLVGQGHLEKAAYMIVAHADAFDGRCYGPLLYLLEHLQQEYPAAAWVLYRALLLDILDSKRYKAYHHAADYLSITNDLASRADLISEQEELLCHLKDKHGRKSSFWSFVNA